MKVGFLTENKNRKTETILSITLGGIRDEALICHFLGTHVDGIFVDTGVWYEITTAIKHRMRSG
ncbi:MAG TPA: hypothetical protein DIT01_01350 [Lentisphaeria bacterium]|nr:hypothetical protein [Lentisphaeria bacterium]